MSVRTDNDRSTSDINWSQSLRGGWLNILAPSIALLVTIIGETIGFPGWLSAVAIVVIWFAGFVALIRVQFGRRHQNTDVFKAFWRTTTLGFVLLAILVVAMYLRGRA